MILGFRHFSPFKGTPPNAFGWHGNDIVVRARHLLTHRTAKELRAAIKIVNWMLDSKLVQDEHYRRLAEGIVEPDAVTGEAHRSPRKSSKTAAEPATSGRRVTDNPHSSVFELLLCRSSIDISGHEDFPNATWHEFLAVLALGLIDQACDDEARFSSWASDGPFDALHQWRIETHVADWLLEAMDSLRQ